MMIYSRCIYLYVCSKIALCCLLFIGRATNRYLFQLSVYTTEHARLKGSIMLFYQTCTILRIDCVSSFRAGSYFLCIKISLQSWRPPELQSLGVHLFINL